MSIGHNALAELVEARHIYADWCRGTQRVFPSFCDGQSLVESHCSQTMHPEMTSNSFLQWGHFVSLVLGIVPVDIGQVFLRDTNLQHLTREFVAGVYKFGE